MTECPRESEVLEATIAGQAFLVRRSPGEGGRPADPELADHLDACPSCREASIVVAALRTERDAAWEEASLPTSHVVWLRAQMQARAEATRLASRPIAVVQALGVACAVGVIAALVGTSYWWLRSWVVWLGDAASLITSAPGTFEMAALASRGILLAVGVWLVLAPVAVYLAATED
jgi:predicted anti-sigma-YlaC factor YlaD